MRYMSQVTTQPAFFRAPMLTSHIHTKWDAGFCASTTYLLQQTGLSWSDLALSETERTVVEHHEAHNEWLTPSQQEKTQESENERTEE
jgi:hypothetical protein